MTGAELIAAERQRQVESEGFTPEHDDIHDGGEMAEAAVCYLLNWYCSDGAANCAPPHMWPWEESWWKPSDDEIRNYVKAGALIAAEIDRLQREQSQPENH